MSEVLGLLYPNANESVSKSRKDGSPFINLVMCVPLRDQYGKVRYFLGAQLDITSLVMNCTELDSLQKLVEQQGTKLGSDGSAPNVAEAHQQDAFEQLSETFNPRELETLLASQQRHYPTSDEANDANAEFIHRRVQNVSLGNSSTNLNSIFQLNGQGSAPPLGFYQNVKLLSMTDRYASTDKDSTFLSDPIHLSGSFSHPPIFESPEYCRLLS